MRRLRNPIFMAFTCVRWCRALPWLAMLCLLAGGVQARHATEGPLTLQLKWRHQFQFAGYYAAQARGFYRDEGLQVNIREGGPDRPPVATVLGGTAQFAIGDSDLLVQRIKGQPLVALAAIFQHSPYILLSRADRGIRVPSDLAGARVMLSDDQGSIQLRSMLWSEGVDPRLVQVVPQSWRLEDLIEGRVDAISAYSTVEPAKLRAAGVIPSIMRSLDYGVDFYGDILFTSESQARRDPERTAAFVRASRKGWDYAMKNPQEIAGLILAMDGVAARGVTREELLQEAEAMRPLVLPDVVEAGHMNPGRFDSIARQLAGLGLVPANYSLEGWIFNPSQGVDPRTLRWAMAGGAAILGAAFLVLVWNLQMRRSVKLRTEQLQAEIERRNEIQKRLKASQVMLVRLNADLEERVRRRTAELEASNKELEAFSYSVSHDLRSPLSTINGFSMLLQKLNAGSKLGEKGDHYLQRIREGTRHMAELIEGLLALARLSRDVLHVGPVDLSALARQVERECREREPDRRVEVLVQDGLVVTGDPVLLLQLMQNLLGNAWKFTSRLEQARIEFGARPADVEGAETAGGQDGEVEPGGRGGDTVYFVRDNGAGFDMAHSDRLFGTFQRLHRPDDFAGTGIGLAIVRRIVARHGGRVWAEGAPDQGATFSFTLGVREEAVAAPAPQ